MCFFISDSQSEGQMGTLMENVVLFSKTLLQKLYSGTFLADSESLLNFLTDQIVVVRQTHRETRAYSRYLIWKKYFLHKSDILKSIKLQSVNYNVEFCLALNCENLPTDQKYFM